MSWNHLVKAVKQLTNGAINGVSDRPKLLFYEIIHASYASLIQFIYDIYLLVFSLPRPLSQSFHQIDTLL